MSDKNKPQGNPKSSERNHGNLNESSNPLGRIEKSNLPDYKYTPPPPTNDKPSNKK